jgi:CheY-like chemotaxis protein
MGADQDTIPEPGLTILVVDDSRVMRQALKKILAKVYVVVEAADGEEGWSRILQDPAVCCVYTDLSMPRLDGYGLIRRIRESGDPRVREMPIVLITGNEDSEGTRERAMSAGASGVVQKPFNADDILEIARRHVDPRRGQPPGDVAAADGEAAEPGRLRERVSELEATLLDLRKQLQSWQEEAQRATASSLSASEEWEQTLNAMREQLRESQEERDRLRRELILRQQSVDEKRVSDRIRELEDQLAAERSELERLRAETGDLEAGLTAAREAASEASSRADDLEARLQSVLSAHERAREEAGSLRRELESTRAGHQAVEQALGLERGKVVELQARLQALDGDESEWAARLAGTEQELSEWQARAREAEQVLERAGSEIPGGAAGREEDLARELESERERLRDLEAELAGMRERAEALEARTPDEDALESLRVRAENAELNQLQLEDEMVEMATRMERSDAARAAAEDELRALMQELADAKRELRERAVAPPPAPEEPEAPDLEELLTDEEPPVEEPDDASSTDAAAEVPVLESTDDTFDEAEVPQLRFEQDGAESRPAIDGDGTGPVRDGSRDPIVRQWEEERRRQRRLQMIILIAVAVVAALGLLIFLI